MMKITIISFFPDCQQLIVWPSKSRVGPEDTERSVTERWMMILLKGVQKVLYANDEN